MVSLKIKNILEYLEIYTHTHTGINDSQIKEKKSQRILKSKKKNKNRIPEETLDTTTYAW